MTEEKQKDTLITDQGSNDLAVFPEKKQPEQTPKSRNSFFSKMTIFYICAAVITTVTVGLIFANANNTNQNELTITDVSDGARKSKVPSINPEKPWDHYITTEPREQELKKLTASIKNISTTSELLAVFQEYLSNYELSLETIDGSIYGKESKSFSNEETEHLKTFGVVLIDEIYKYPDEILSSIGIEKIQLTNGTLSYGERSGLNGLADFANNKLIYNATSLLTESDGRQQFNPTWEKYVRQVIQHEIGHFTHFQLDLTNENYPMSWGEWSKLNKSDFGYLMSCEDANPLAKAEAPIPEGFVTSNATTCPAEDWADTYAALMDESGIGGGKPRDSYFKAKESFIREMLVDYEASFETVFQ